MELRGMVLGKTLASNPSYHLLAAEGKRFFVKQFACETDFEVGAVVAVNGREEKAIVEAGEITGLKGADGEGVRKEINALAEAACAPLDSKPLFDDEVMRSLEPALAKAARLLMESVFFLKPILMRFHDDPDGVCSALAISEALRDFDARNAIAFPKNFLKTKQSDSAIYEQKHFLDDNEWALGFSKKPLLVLLDHGGNEESLAQLKEAAARFDILVIDHHPPAEEVEKIAKAFVNPFNCEGGGSDYTAGLLSFEVARKISPKTREALAWISLQGDNSSFRKGDRKEVLVLEYLAAENKSDSLEDYAKALASPQSVELLCRKAAVRLKDVLEQAQKHSRFVEAGEALIQIINAKALLQKNRFPSKAKAVNELQRLAELKHSGKPVVSIAFVDDSLSFRGNAEAHALGFKANALISSLKRELPHAVESGGGHERAASMRFKKEFAQTVLDKTLEETKKIF